MYHLLTIIPHILDASGGEVQPELNKILSTVMPIFMGLAPFFAVIMTAVYGISGKFSAKDPVKRKENIHAIIWVWIFMCVVFLAATIVYVLRDTISPLITQIN